MDGGVLGIAFRMRGGLRRCCNLSAYKENHCKKVFAADVTNKNNIYFLEVGGLKKLKALNQKNISFRTWYGHFNKKHLLGEG